MQSDMVLTWKWLTFCSRHIALESRFLPQTEAFLCITHVSMAYVLELSKQYYLGILQRFFNPMATEIYLEQL